MEVPGVTLSSAYLWTGKSSEGMEIPAEKQQWFIEELNKLLNEDIEVDVEKIPLSSLVNINCKITDVVGLSILFDDTK